jgi:putative tricarboxylic transport membrane protein
VKRSDLATGTFWLIFCLGAAVESYRLGLGHFRAPGPGFVPFVIALCFAALAALLLIQTLGAKAPKDQAAADTEKRNRFKVFSVIAVLLVYVFFLETLGFIVCTFLLIAYLLKIAGEMGWLSIATAAALATVVTYALFHGWLRVQLPAGVLPLNF